MAYKCCGKFFLSVLQLNIFYLGGFLMDSSFFDYEKFKNDNIRAIDAKFEAQKIAFAPLTYQAIRTMLETGILSEIENAGDAGITRGALSEKTKISEYGVGVLCEMALGMDVIKLSKDSVPG